MQPYSKKVTSSVILNAFRIYSFAIYLNYTHVECIEFHRKRECMSRILKQ